MISEALRDQITRGEAKLPLALGASRRVPTTEGSVIVRRLESGLVMELALEVGTAFLPFLGEFGCLIADYARAIHAHPAKRKLVFCRHGEECLFPSATEFRYDWTEAPDDRLAGVAGTEPRELPGWKVVAPNAKADFGKVAKVKFMPAAPERLPMVDVVIAPRVRRVAKGRNWQHWRELVIRLRSLGLKVGVAGVQATSQAVDADCFAWQHPGGATAGTVDLLSKCRLYIGTDSGVSHLAALMDSPSIIINQGVNVRNQLAELRSANRGYVDILPASDWEGTNGVIDAVKRALFPCEEAVRILSVGGEGRRALGDCAARSIRRMMPGMAIELRSDVQRSEFPTVLVAKCGDRDSRRYKINLLKNAPREWMAVIDDDTVTMRRFPGVREMLERSGCDIAMLPDYANPTIAHVLRHQGWAKDAEKAVMMGLEAETHWNSGVIFFRRSAAVEALADVWLEEWERFRDVDQLALVRALKRTGLRVGKLPRELHYFPDVSGAPKPAIVHFMSRKWKSADWKRAHGLALPASRGLVAFSLFGQAAKYSQGLLENCALLGGIYPGWSIRVYCERGHRLAPELRAFAEVVEMPSEAGRGGACWRFLAAEALAFTHVIFRDADSRINPREKAAVEEWLVSGKALHVMRDHPVQTNRPERPIPAGMWGVRTGFLSEIAAKLAASSRAAYGDDERFLAAHVWPLFSTEQRMIHSCRPATGEKTFPAHAPWKGHVGQAVRVCCGGGKPSLRKQAAGIARALGGVVADVVAGRKPTVTDDVRKARLAICQSCSLRNGKRCGLCGCFLSAITWLNQDKCEAGKWPKTLP